MEPELVDWLGDLEVRASEGVPGTPAVAAVRAARTAQRVAAPVGAEESSFARALSNLYVELLAVGMRDDARRALEEACRVYRELARSSAAATILFDWGRALTRLTELATEDGRTEDAIDLASRSLKLHDSCIRSGAAPDVTEAFIPGLAAALDALATAYARLGRREEALGFSSRAVPAHRRLAAKSAEAGAWLIMALGRLANALAAAGRHADAVAPGTEAIQLARKLAAQGVEGRVPIAGLLTNLSSYLADSGRRKEAVKPAEEAVVLQRRVVGAPTPESLHDLAVYLTNLGTRYAHVGRSDQALRALTHAVAAARKVLPHRRDLALPRLGESLNNLANRFVEAKRLDEAVRAAGEAVEVRRELAAGLPDVFAPQLAVSLTTLAGCRSGAGDAVGAVDAAEEAVRTILPYFRREPIAFLTTMRACAQNWRVYCRKGHVKPDFVLSRRVDTVLSQFPE